MQGPEDKCWRGRVPRLNHSPQGCTLSGPATENTGNTQKWEPGVIAEDGEERLGGASGAAGRTFHDVNKIPGRKDWDPKTELALHPSRRGTRSGTEDMPDKGRPQASGVHPRQTGRAWGKGARQLPPANLLAPNRGSEPTRTRPGSSRARDLDENLLLSLCHAGVGGARNRDWGGPAGPRRSSRSPRS